MENMAGSQTNKRLLFLIIFLTFGIIIGLNARPIRQYAHHMQTSGPFFYGWPRSFLVTNKKIVVLYGMTVRMDYGWCPIGAFAVEPESIVIDLIAAWIVLTIGTFVGLGAQVLCNRLGTARGDSSAPSEANRDNPEQ